MLATARQGGWEPGMDMMDPMLALPLCTGSPVRPVYLLSLDVPGGGCSLTELR